MIFVGMPLALFPYNGYYFMLCSIVHNIKWCIGHRLVAIHLTLTFRSQLRHTAHLLTVDSLNSFTSLSRIVVRHSFWPYKIRVKKGQNKPHWFDWRWLPCKCTQHMQITFQALGSKEQGGGQKPGPRPFVTHSFRRSTTVANFSLIGNIQSCGTCCLQL